MSELEKQAHEIHQRFLEPLAKRLAFDLPRWPAANARTPVILFLGNHSSGKSSFINFLLGQNVQATGLAPTDDGFTLITWGSQSSTVDGPTITTHPQLDLSDLAHLGPAFTAKLRLKTLPHELLRTVTLVDSPGMIDAIGSANTRGYDFHTAVHAFAERADLILFFFDPDKPGTTAETIFVLTQILGRLGYKLILVLNKVDQFAGFRDFARTYGALCWNLAKAIPTKDIPHIATCYVPAAETVPDRQPGGIPLSDFDISRTEILAEIRRAPGRRADNMVTELLHRGTELLVHGRVCREIARDYRRLRLQWLGALLLTSALAGMAIWQAWQGENVTTRVWVILVSAGAIAAAWWFGRWQAKRFARRSLNMGLLDEAFTTACENELGLRNRADLHAVWAGVRDRTARALQLLGPGKLAMTMGLSRQLSRLEKLLERDIPTLRRDLLQAQPELQIRDVTENRPH